VAHGKLGAGIGGQAGRRRCQRNPPTTCVERRGIRSFIMSKLICLRLWVRACSLLMVS
jgi:hypothetical protein